MIHMYEFKLVPANNGEVEVSVTTGSLDEALRLIKWLQYLGAQNADQTVNPETPTLLPERVSEVLQPNVLRTNHKYAHAIPKAETPAELESDPAKRKPRLKRGNSTHRLYERMEPIIYKYLTDKGSAGHSPRATSQEIRNLLNAHFSHEFTEEDLEGNGLPNPIPKWWHRTTSYLKPSMIRRGVLTNDLYGIWGLKNQEPKSALQSQPQNKEKNT